jgi:hypothetical protein
MCFIQSIGYNIAMSFYFLCFLFWCPFGILPVCLGAPLRFFNEFAYRSKKKKKPTRKENNITVHREWFSSVF